MRNLIVSMGLLLAASLADAAEFSHPQYDAIRDALAEMTQQDYDSFIIVDVEGSNNYFQYASDGGSRYLFDVPALSLSAEQLSRARKYFEDRGVPLARFVDAGPDLSNFSFQKWFGNEQLDAGVNLGLGFLNKVLRSGQQPLVIKRGWE